MTAGFVRQLLERPRQLWLRKAAFQVHLWLGVVLALYVVAIGVSGSILVFRDELLPRPRVHLGAPAYGCAPAQLVSALASVSRAYPTQQAYLAGCPDEAVPLIAVTLRGRLDTPRNAERTVFLDPHTGAILGEADREHSWVNIVERFHLELLLPRNGRIWNGVGAAILLVVALTGVAIWWPGRKRWTRALKVDLRLSWKRITFDLHGALGVWTLAFTLIWAVSGISFAWPNAVTRVVSRLSPIRTANYPEQAMRSLEARTIPAGPPSLDLGQVLAQAQQLSPHSSLSGIFYGSGPKAILTVYMARQRPGDYANTDFLYFDQHTGRHLLTWHRGQNQMLGDWIVWSLAPLHFGQSWGLGAKVLWAVAGIAFPVLAVTGLLLYWNRWLSKRWRRLTAKS